MVDLSLIIISWRMKDILVTLLQSVKNYTRGVLYEIIVVDNNSLDGTSEVIREQFPEIRLIMNEENRGVAGARNQGMSLAQGRYFMFLDADMLLTENSIKKMVDFMDHHPDAGICGAQLVFPDKTIQPSGRRYPTPLAFLLRRLEFMEFARNSNTLRRHEMADWDRKDTRPVDYVIGACQIIRREAFQQVGLLDDKIFYGPEDIDYCYRMYRSGWKVYYFPETQIIHFEQRTTKKKIFSRLSWLHLKGVIYFFMKHGGRLSTR